MKYLIREMRIDDYENIYSFWKSIEGLTIDDTDSYENLNIYLKRNPNLCYIAVSDNQIIGTIKCGQDGRRGYLHHLAVDKHFQKQGIGRQLINKSLHSLKSQGITKCNLFVLDTNKDALAFWQHNNWEELDYYYRTLQKNI